MDQFNSTLTGFNNVQKGFLPVVAVPCLLISFLLYRFAKRPLEYEETINKRMEYLYSLVSAALLGHIVFGIQPNIQQPYPACIGIGFFIMICLQKLARVWKENDFVSTDLNDNEISDIIDPQTFEIFGVQVEDDLGSENVPLTRDHVTNQSDELKKRRIIVFILLICAFFIAPIDGMFLSARAPLRGQTIMVVMYWISKLIQTVVVSVAMAHALLHGVKVRKFSLYALISFVWATACALSTLPAILDYRSAVEQDVGLMVFYALSTGVMLWIAVYFLWIDRKETDRKKTTIRLVVFALTFVGVWITSFFI